MPLREFNCQKCGHAFEALERNKDEKISCPSCGSFRLKRKLSCFATTCKSGHSSCSSCQGGSCSSCR